MKYWWRNFIKDYLTFSKKDRKGLLIFFILLVAIILISHYFPVKKTVAGKDAFQKELAQLKISIDSSKSNNRYTNEEYHADYSRPKEDRYSNNFKGEMFAFDPNTLDAAGWKRLGVKDRTITTIQNFIAKGYKFRQPSDIQKIYGLRKEDAERLIPYVHIAGKEPVENRAPVTANDRTTKEETVGKVAGAKIIDINIADTAAFIALPGIGNKLAARIVNFREKLGGFRSVDQLAETYGIPDSTFQLIRPRLQCNNPALKRMNINTAEINELRVHPYFKWNLANAIVNYRKQHGNYKSLEDLRKIDIINDEIFNKISPYLNL